MLAALHLHWLWGIRTQVLKAGAEALCSVSHLPSPALLLLLLFFEIRWLCLVLSIVAFVSLLLSASQMLATGLWIIYGVQASGVWELRWDYLGFPVSCQAVSLPFYLFFLFKKWSQQTLTVKFSEIQELCVELLLCFFVFCFPEMVWLKIWLKCVLTPCVLISKANPQQMLETATDNRLVVKRDEGMGVDFITFSSGFGS